MNADEIRSKIIELFNQFKPALDDYYDYGQQVAALAEEYHAARLREVYRIEPTEETLIATLDARATPKSLDNWIAANSTISVKRILFDRAAGKYYLWV